MRKFFYIENECNLVLSVRYPIYEVIFLNSKKLNNINKTEYMHVLCVARPLILHEFVFIIYSLANGNFGILSYNVQANSYLISMNKKWRVTSSVGFCVSSQI